MKIQSVTIVALTALTLGCREPAPPSPGKLTTRPLLIIRDNSINLESGPSVTVLLEVDVSGGVLTEDLITAPCKLIVEDEKKRGNIDGAKFHLVPVEVNLGRQNITTHEEFQKLWYQTELHNQTIGMVTWETHKNYPEPGDYSKHRWEPSLWDAPDSTMDASVRKKYFGK